MTSLSEARKRVLKDNPNLPMKLRFEVSPKNTVDELLSVPDLTQPVSGERNVVGKIYDQVLEKLKEHGFPNVCVVREDPTVRAEDNFDNLLFPQGNPSRSSTYTRYVDEDHVLRTHTSALIPETFRKFEGQCPATFVLPGLVYRRDVIDPSHLDVFHQIDVWTLQKKNGRGSVTREDLLHLVGAVFEAACPDAEMIVNEADHPYTVNGIEVCAKQGSEEIEVLEAGLINPGVLERAGLDPKIYCGLALGMGIERLVMARKALPDIRLIRSTDPRIAKQMTHMDVYEPVSMQPPISRDMSYCVSQDDTEEDICESIRNAFGTKSDLLEQVDIIARTPYEDLHENAVRNLGATKGQDNVLVRIVLRHPDHSLTKVEASKLYTRAYPKIHQGNTEGYT